VPVGKGSPSPSRFSVAVRTLHENPQGALDGVRDMANQALDDELQRVRDHLDAVLARRFPN